MGDARAMVSFFFPLIPLFYRIGESLLEIPGLSFSFFPFFTPFFLPPPLGGVYEKQIKQKGEA